MAKKPTKTRPLSKPAAESALPDGLVSLEPIPYPVADTKITALQVYHNPERKPSGDDPWNDEADKVAWVDEDTGFACIMLRQKNGTLSGYVGIGPEHPVRLRSGRGASEIGQLRAWRVDLRKGMRGEPI